MFHIKNLMVVIFAFGFLISGALAKTLPYQDPDLPVERRVKDLLSRMTLDEKIGQMNMVFSSEILNKERSELVPGTIEKYFGDQQIGSIKNLGNARYMFTLKPAKIAEIANKIQKFAKENTRLGIPVLIVEESLHGYAAQGATVFPQCIGLAGAFDPELIEEIGSVIAKEIKITGAHQTYAPNLDVGREPRWGRIEETFGEDPYLVSKLGTAMVKGLQGSDFGPDSVIATVKHFTAYGDPQWGLNMGPVDISERTLREVFLPPFKAAIVEGNAQSVMPGYNAINGVPCHSSELLLTDILKTEWGFKGYVVEDNTGIQRIADLHHIAANHKEAIRMAINNGLDANLFPLAGFHRNVRALVEEGKISQARIDEAVGRILRLKFLLGLFDGKNIHSDPRIAEAVCNAKEHRKLALEAARKSVVLLKNEKSLLPLNIDDIDSIAVIGPSADAVRIGNYSGRSEVVTVLEGIENKVPSRTNVLYSQGCSLTGPSTGGFSEAVQAAEEADVAVVVLGGASHPGPSPKRRAAIEAGEITCGEGIDRADLDLPGVQRQLAKAVYQTGTPVVVVLLNGRPLSTPWVAENIPAILEGWYPGEEGGTAIAEILFGDVNPSGKLAVSIPRTVGQLPVFYNHRDRHLNPVGYIFADETPLYSFGHGLSYSTFEYSDLRVTPERSGPAGKFEVSVTVRNSSDIKGDEVVQLYVNDVVSSISTPLKELKGFRRITLEPKESKTVKFVLGSEHLSLLDKNMEEVVEPGTFEIMIDDLKARFDVVD